MIKRFLPLALAVVFCLAFSIKRMSSQYISAIPPLSFASYQEEFPRDCAGYNGTELSAQTLACGCPDIARHTYGFPFRENGYDRCGTGGAHGEIVIVNTFLQLATTGGIYLITKKLVQRA